MKKIISIFSFILLVAILSSCGNKEEKEVLLDPEIDATIMVDLCHNQSLTDADMSPDGKYIVTVSRDNKLIIWDLATKRELKVVNPTSAEDKSKKYASVEYTSDGKLLIVGTFDDKILIIDAETLTVTKEVAVAGFGGETIAISKDDKYVAVEAKDDKIQLIDLTAGSVFKTFEGHTQFINKLSISPDNKFILSGSNDSTARIWDIEKGEEIKKIDIGEQVDYVAYNVDGNKFLVNTNGIKQIQVWDVAKMKKLFTIEDYATSSLFRGDKIITQHNAGITIWNGETGEEISEIKNGGYGLKLSNDNKFAINTYGEEVEITDLDAEKVIVTFANDVRMVKKVHFSPSGKFIVTENTHKSGSGGPDILSYAIDTNFAFHAYPTSGSGTNILDFLGNTDVLLTGEYYSEQQFYDLATGKVLREFDDKIGEPFCITSDGLLIVAQDNDKGDLYATFNPETGEKITDIIEDDAYHYFSGITPDDKYYVLLTMDFFKVFELPSCKEVATYERKEMSSIIFIDQTTDGVYIVGRKDMGDFIVNDIMTGAEVFRANDIGAEYAVLSPDKKHYAVACEDWTVKIFDIVQNKEIATLKSHIAPVVSVAYSPDGKYIVSSAQDNQMKIWTNPSTPEGQFTELLTIIGLEKTSEYEGETKDYIVFAPNGRYDGTEAGIAQFLYFEKDGKRLPVSDYKEKCYTKNLLGRTLGQSFIEFQTEAE